MIELEKTYLAKYLPKDLFCSDKKEIIDIYIPASFDHPKIRIRKNGDKFEITKKEPVADDPSEMLEQTIKLSEAEFSALSKTVEGKRLSKIRHYYNFGDCLAEIDIFQDDLLGLVLVDFEFENSKGKASFVTPDFCLADITSEKFTAGGMLCGKKYSDIEAELERYNYQKIL